MKFYPSKKEGDAHAEGVGGAEKGVGVVLTQDLKLGHNKFPPCLEGGRRGAQKVSDFPIL